MKIFPKRSPPSIKIFSCPQVSSVEQLRAFLGGGTLGGGPGVDESDETALYATLSSVRSACSATTSANDDFEFFHHEIKQQVII
jgi:hypothetical protein